MTKPIVATVIDDVSVSYIGELAKRYNVCNSLCQTLADFYSRHFVHALGSTKDKIRKYTQDQTDVLGATSLNGAQADSVGLSNQHELHKVTPHPVSRERAPKDCAERCQQGVFIGVDVVDGEYGGSIQGVRRVFGGDCAWSWLPNLVGGCCSLHGLVGDYGAFD